ncbi:tRNA pseudouridine(55) synthase TruB [Nisaea acidiphila]|uniref:tRNA pseudouridine synthase B n=1 Tax=Nisaea acidiphila TaxID=1862145 RepID=A0A9J7AZA7_9PROT|nr:tRNA pseudouridine(55) synthase TruB [Nisaea acidiphila]UUX52114.1 tRNA pseudouridine(55) synthase TruB [Nisaea acidiphila]
MARRKRGNPVNGWVILDKPSGVTSTQAVSAVRRVFDAQKAGHAGTLDPLATGILPIALGEATKTVPYVMDASKEYTFEVTWGEERSTDDLEGDVTSTSDIRPDEQAILAALPQFVGTITQVPPKFSAVKIQGQRAYDLARNEEPVELSPREVRIDFFDLVEMRGADRALFKVGSGKGAYMRSLARDLARATGTVGHISMLRRHRVGPFLETDAISLDSLKALEHSPAAFEHLMPVETALDGIPALTLAGAEANKLRCGQSVPVFRAMDLDRFGDLREGDLMYAVSGGSPVAIGRIDGGCICPMRVLNL